MPVNHSNDSTQNCSVIRLVIQGIGHVPSFKNNKSIFRNRKTGKPFIATLPQRKQWMERAQRLIESQLLSAFRTAMPEMQTAQHLRSWIVSSLPLDDSYQWLNEIHIKVFKVKRGEEGAVIEIAPQ